MLSCSQKTSTSSSTQKAPDFELRGLDGRIYNFSAQTAGKVVILDFWATWCPPCKAEIPHFQDLYVKYKNKGLVIIGIALDRGGTASVLPFIRENNVTYPILIGEGRVAADYGGVRSIPTTFIIDRKGNIVRKFVGYQNKEVFESAIRNLL